jgi:hypothetical protein
MAKHWIMLTVIGFLTAGVVFAVVYYLYNRFFISRRPWPASIRKHLPVRFFQRISSGAGFMATKQRQSYELVRRDEEDGL